MYPIQGTWFGEYSINDGTNEQPDIKYFHFELRVKEDENGFTGKFIDKTLKTHDSEIQGFLDNDFISFLRNSSQQAQIVENLRLKFENKEKKIEFHFSGNYIETEDCYQGFWEVEVEEEREGLQDSFLDETRVGAWYMRKLG